MNAVSVVGLVILIVGAISIVASSDANLKGSRAYTFKGGITLSGLGMLVLIMGARCF